MIQPATPAPHRWRNAPVLREPDRKRARRAISVFAAIAFACSPLGIYLLQIMRHVEIDYAIEDLRTTQERLAEAERRLWIERAELASFPDVERKAVKALGLVRPEPLATIVLHRDGVSRTHSPDPRSPGRAR